jgi:hypothetical protein
VDVEVGRGGELLEHGLAVEVAVGLCPGPPHGRALAAVEHLEVDACEDRTSRFHHHIIDDMIIDTLWHMQQGINPCPQITWWRIPTSPP